jgi:DNA-directed RNA polymerase sigma subunit (sigma70/sigma32)
LKNAQSSAATPALGDKEMAEREEVGDRTIRVPEHLIETINRLVRTSRQMLTEIGREPTPEELAKKLAMPLEKVLRVLKIAKQPISLESPIKARLPGWARSQ